MCLGLCQNREKIVIDLLYCEPEHGDFQLFRESVKGGGGLTNESGASEYIFLSFSVFQEALLSGSEFNVCCFLLEKYRKYIQYCAKVLGQV